MKTFVITAGHGGTDPGALGNGRKEAEIALELRDLVVLKLTGLGHKVHTDGARKVNGLFAHALSLIGLAPICVDLHCNASSNPNATGSEAISLPRHKKLASKLAQACSTTLDTRLRGDRGWIDQSQSARGRLAYVERGGVILEMFFITNANDLQAYESRKWLVASAIAKVLAEA